MERSLEWTAFSYNVGFILDGTRRAAAAEHGHAADGALRPQDQGVFEDWARLDTSADLVVRRR